MGQTGFFHHIGSFMLFMATILLLVTTISSPIVPGLAFLEVGVGAGAHEASPTNVTFGTFGYCVYSPGMSAVCSPRQIGYSPLGEMAKIDSVSYNASTTNTTATLTKGMVLHPVGCGLNFVAFLMGAGAGVVGSFLASGLALLAAAVTLVVVIIDFAGFAMVRTAIDADGTGSFAYFGPAAWTLLVSGICSVLGMVLLFLTCCSRRMHSMTKTVSF